MLPRQHARIRLLLGTLLVIAPFARRHTEVTIRSLARRNGTGERLRATRVRWVVLRGAAAVGCTLASGRGVMRARHHCSQLPS